jgi:hypothetical protein
MRNGAKDCLTRAPVLLTCRAGDPPLEHRLRSRRLPQSPPFHACEPGPGSHICLGHVAAREPAATTRWRHRNKMAAVSGQATVPERDQVRPRQLRRDASDPLRPQGLHRCRTAGPSTGIRKALMGPLRDVDCSGSCPGASRCHLTAATDRCPCRFGPIQFATRCRLRLAYRRSRLGALLLAGPRLAWPGSARVDQPGRHR